MKISGMTKKGAISALAEVACVLVLLVVAVGCGSNSGDDPPRDGMTMGEVDALMRASNGVDTDGDYLPDDVELALGTDPYSPDSDMDGMFDYGEVFSGDYSGPGDLVPDYDYDGVIAALDPDDDGDGLHDGDGVDSDGDGIANYLEYFGYTYNWFMDEYSLWTGADDDIYYFKTDPLQPSTDQDPYSDGMESSGALMDVLVEAPGDLPMIPAYPNIVVRLEGYDVTLNSEISYSHGGSMSEETSWSREASVETAFEAGVSFEVGAEAKVGVAEWLTLSAKAGGNFSTTMTSGSTVGFNESITQESNWNKAVSSNPSTAARVKLKLKVYNFGTAAASNIAPTLTMKIGGMSVFTFKAGNPIGILEPGGAYPSQNGTYWVVDKTDSGDDIYLTINELRALETGTPLKIEVTQVEGEVMMLGLDGQWSSAGQWAEYMARCEAVSANIKLDIGNGNFVHQLVYADDSPFSPTVTLGDALRWIAQYEERDGDGFITYRDRFGVYQETSLAGWNFIFDRETLERNNLLSGGDSEEEFHIKDIVLNQDSEIIARAPRETLDLLGPDIYYAYYDAEQGLVNVRAGDYNGITDMFFVDVSGVEHAMTEVLANSGVFVFDVGQLDDGLYEPTYFNDGLLVEAVRAVNRDGQDATKRLSAAYQADKPDSPIDIVSVSIDEGKHTLTATLSTDPYFPPTSVTLYYQDKVQALEPHPMNWHPDYKNKWIYIYDSNFVPTGFIDAWVIAEVADVDCDSEFNPTVEPDYSSDCLASYQVASTDIVLGTSACVIGSLSLSGYTTNVGLYYNALYNVVDFDVGPSAGECSEPLVESHNEDIWFNIRQPYADHYDLALLTMGQYSALLEDRFEAFEVIGIEYEAIIKSNIKSYATQAGEAQFHSWSYFIGNYTFWPNTVWILKTSEGRYVKILLKKISGTGYIAHATNHVDMSYAVYDFTSAP